MSGARGRLGSHRAAESRGPGADSGAFVPRPGRSAGRELAGENGAGERLVVRADVLELAGILTVARHLLAQGVAVLAHRLLDLVRDDLLEQARSEEHTSELQSLTNLVCRLLLEKKK